ncbi:MAG: aminoacetone oxidase family FAD-binding enzyme [Aristaeellaceae bacterium]
MAEVLIIGAGAAGMAAAIEAAFMGERVLLLERMDRVGKKLLATGNGRCNLMNEGALRYPGGGAFAEKVLSRCGAAQQRQFWQRLGLRLRTEEGGRVYPVSGQASTVLDTLRLAMDALHVDIITGVHVDAVTPGKRGFTVSAGENRWQAARVIVTGGGCAQPKLGSDGSCYGLLAALGHHMIRPEPCLTQIITDPAPIRGLSGIRVKCRVLVQDGSRVLHEESGEALFTDYGMSGVCVMQCARYARQGRTLSLSLAEGMGFADREDALQELMRRQQQWRDQPMERLLTGLCVPRLASALCAAAGITWKNRLIGSLKRSEATTLANLLTDWPLTILGVKGFEAAQVTRGGADCREFDPATMASRLVPGLHAAGEVLDVDGDCGGFNLMFAFGSGMLAGRNGR